VVKSDIIGAVDRVHAMAKLRIRVPSENFETTITLLDKEAPTTCASITNILPIEGKLLHGTSSGMEALTELEGEKKVRIEPENWVTNCLPGDVLYWHSLWGDGRFLKGKRENAELCFVYGRHVKLRDLDLRETAANLFGTFDSKLDEFAALSRRIRLEGAKLIVIDSLASG
jgi:hypothetical protein